MNKTMLRKALLQKRDRLTRETVANKSNLITERLLASGLIPSDGAVMSYLSFRNEVDTTELHRLLFKERDAILVPYTDEENQIHPCVYRKDDTFSTGRFGVSLPSPLRLTEKVPNVLIMPCIGVDRNGNRLGFGKGCYDRFLADKPQIKKIILAYDFQVSDRVPATSYDVPADYIITESSVVKSR